MAILLYVITGYQNQGAGGRQLSARHRKPESAGFPHTKIFAHGLQPARFRNVLIHVMVFNSLPDTQGQLGTPWSA